MDPESFLGKLALNAIDKLVIGVAVLLLGGHFQLQAYKNQKELDARMAVSKVYTDILLKQQDSLDEAIDKYCFLLEGLKGVGSAKDEEMSALRELRQRISFTINTLGAGEPQIKENAQPLLNSIEEMNGLLGSGMSKISDEKIANTIESILKQRMPILAAIHQVTIEKLVKDPESASTRL